MLYGNHARIDPTQPAFSGLTKPCDLQWQINYQLVVSEASGHQKRRYTFHKFKYGQH